MAYNLATGLPCHKRLRRRIRAGALLAFIVATVLPISALAESVTQPAGRYTVKLTVSKNRPFVAKAAAHQPRNAGAMVYAGGAPATANGSTDQPNHLMTVSLTKNGQPVKRADIRLRYRKNGESRSTELPITRMWVAGKGQKTMRFGHALRLSSGFWHVLVSVNHRVNVRFEISVGNTGFF